MSRSTPPPAQNLTILAADLLAVAAKRIVIELACAPSWEPMQALKHALDTYESARLEGIVRDPDPQRRSVNEWPPSPETQRSEARP